MQLEEKMKELTLKVEDLGKQAAGVAVQSPKDLPFLLACGFQDSWTTAGSTITYSYLPSEYPSGGDSFLDATTGIFTARTAGFYTVTYSAQVNASIEIVMSCSCYFYYH